MSRPTNILIPVAALLLVTFLPPGTGSGCDWQAQPAAARAESPAWFVTLLTFLHSERIATEAAQRAEQQETAQRARLTDNPHSRTTDTFN